MPWKEVSVMSLRQEFVALAQADGANVRELCHRFGISPTTGYKWLSRFRRDGEAGLCDLPRRPHTSPLRTPSAVEELVLRLRDEHPAWGGRKLRRRLLDVGYKELPSPSTITAILKRHNRISPDESPKHKAFVRFEHEAPNELWQMDFKGHFATDSGRCHPLTVLDDHSRFLLAVDACSDETGQTVTRCLTKVFRRYGTPERMLMDNGSPWNTDSDFLYTPFTLWLMRLGIRVSHGRPRHPQTQGKDERLHRTLMAEAIRGRSFKDIPHCQRVFDDFRDTYNTKRPHQALDFATPISRYHVSTRAFPEVLPPIEYSPSDILRKVQAKGEISFHGREFKVGRAFRGFHVALRPTTTDGLWDVFFLVHKVAHIDLRL